jgi:cyclophilin family peptidyl-prolyl cis-trans isomerase
MNRVSKAVVAVVVAVVMAPFAEIASAQGGAAPAPAARKAAGPVVVLETVKGNIEFETFPEEAPKTVEHILALVRRNFYNGLRIHRVEPGFVVQFGDPQTRDMTKRTLWGTLGSGRPVGAAEMDPSRKHRFGSVAMAHAGDPAKADAQMYIMLRQTATPLDGKYTVFGQVISGMDVVQKLVVTDVIRRATVKP